MKRSLAALAATTVLFTAMGAPAWAQAPSTTAVSVKDSEGDAEKVPSTKAPRVRKDTDILGARFSYDPENKIIKGKVRFNNLRALDLGPERGAFEHSMFVHIQTPTGVDRGFGVERTPWSRGNSGSVYVGDNVDSPCKGDKFRVNMKKDFIAFQVPKKCLTDDSKFSKASFGVYSSGYRAYQDGPRDLAWTDQASQSKSLATP